ncbi:MAG TPA: hypothetical protein VK698_27025 [Kofleriaceae bacterium]|nr:hypothetical protein [Kofleriaceae bacterium]
MREPGTSSPSSEDHDAARIGAAAATRSGRTDAAALEKQVEPLRPWYRRERRAAAGLLGFSAITLTASVTLLHWTFSRPASPAVVRAPVAAAAVDATAAYAASETLEEPTAWVASDDPIGDPIERLAPRDGAPLLRGAAAAADRYGVVALWTDRVVWVSRDDGRSFRQELAAPQPLTAVAVGTDGRVYAARHGGRLGELTPGGRTRWHDVDCDQVLAIDGSSPWLALLCLHADQASGLSSMLYLSSDDGATWRRQITPHHGTAANQIRVSANGVVDLLTLDTETDIDAGQNTDGADAGRAGRLRHYTGHVDGRPFELVLTGDGPEPFGLGHDGQSWRLDGERRMHLTGSTSAGRSSRLAVRNWDVLLAASSERTIAAADGRLVELGADRPRVVASRIPGPIDTLALDGLGRALATAGGVAVRYSALHGWRRLFEIPAH